MTITALFEKHADHNIMTTESLNRDDFQAAVVDLLEDLVKETRAIDSCRNRFKLLVDTLHEAKSEKVGEYY